LTGARRAHPSSAHEPLLDDLQSRALRYFLDEADPLTGLVADSTVPDATCSIAAVGMGLGTFPIAVERGFLRRIEAAARVLRLLQFFRDSAHDDGASSTGFRGFYYHFLDMSTGRRVGRCELSTIDSHPSCAAWTSPAQVHRARLVSGREVVVKVRRPGIEERARRDVGVLLALAEILTGVVPRLRPFDPVGIVRELERSLHLELDFREEAFNIRRFREALVDVPGLWIPDVVEDRSGRTVLTMEHSRGVRVDRYAAEHPERRTEVARAVSALLFRQVFEEGIFHADPHPGNLFVLEDGRVCLHDFGMVGRLRETTRSALERLLKATVRRNVRGAADAYLEMGLADEGLSRIDLEEELSGLIEEIHSRPSREVSVGQALESLVRLGSRHGLRNPSELLLLTRACLITEGVLRQVDPEVDMIELFREQAGELELRRFHPDEVSRRIGELWVGLEAFLRESPGDARRVLRRFADGTLGRVQAPDLEVLLGRGSRAVERLTGGVIAASFVVGGALLAGLDGWHHRAGVILLAGGIALALVVGIGALRGRTDR